MRISSVRVNKHPPIQSFEINDLADLVVVAGPNGVGKTRLFNHLLQHLQNPAGTASTARMVLDATSPEERKLWGKSTLDTSAATDQNLLAQTLQRGRRREIWTSSVLNFESDRTVVKVDPYNFTWDIPDPETEDVNWNISFSGLRQRHQDTLHAIFRKLLRQRTSIGAKAQQLRREGHGSMQLRFEDPMEPFRKVFDELLAPKKLLDPSLKDQQLRYSELGSEFTFASLSSGEREAVTIAFDLVMRRPEHCVIFFDEPELHLHAELAERLIRTLQRISGPNQFILCTHSPDIISASLNNTVVLLQPIRPDATAAANDGDGPAQDSPPPAANQAVVATTEGAAVEALRALGHSVGVMALGRRIVLIEGASSSLDKQLYGRIISAAHPELVLAPSGHRDGIVNFRKLFDLILSRTLWGVEFFMLCDRDAWAGPAPRADEYGGRLRVLPRYHIENYFLDEHVWANVFRDIDPTHAWLCDPARVRERLRSFARQRLSYAVALFVSSQVRRDVGNVDVMIKGHQPSVTELTATITEKLASEAERLTQAMEIERVAAIVNEEYLRLERSLDADTDDWKHDVPGRPMLGEFCGAAGLQKGRAMNLYISKALEQDNEGVFADIFEILGSFAQHGRPELPA